MEHTYQYSWIIPFIPLPVPILLGAGLLLFLSDSNKKPSTWNVFVFINRFLVHTTYCSECLSKAFVTNRVGDFGLLLGILGLYWITGSFEFQDLFEIFNNLILNNRINLLFLTLCAFLLFVGPIAKSAQFPLHVWLPDAMEGPTPISALIHAATMVAAGIFLVARLLLLFFIVIPSIITLRSHFSSCSKRYKRGLAYSTMSQLGYMMLALGSGSIIHSMEAIVGYSPDKSQNMILWVETLSLCGIPPLACFWSKDEILNDSFGKKSSSFYSISLWGKEEDKKLNRNFGHRIPFNQEGIDFDILSKLLTPSINLLHTNSENFVDWYEFLKNAIFSVSIALFGIFIAYCFI
ncbi:hypothetical protein HID58_090074 [Brassica napus]|uniref:NAD(P)H-quinone oxidoreductase subunit 5, chloroplastic n=1 Tax=Brassica napus TaxID=3708 RepID=A0ABQ7XE79_BRANA|nr:hypothetical protein HID58_090074 [Brassica napus]